MKRLDINRLAPREVERLAWLHAACFAPAWTAAALLPLLEPPAMAFIARSEDRDAGFIIARAVADEAEILSVGVVPEFRRQGMARHLVRHVARQCAEKGAKALFLEVGSRNVAARDLYGGLGFEMVGSRKGYYGSGSEDALVLKADLGMAGLGIHPKID